MYAAPKLRSVVIAEATSPGTVTLARSSNHMIITVEAPAAAPTATLRVGRLVLVLKSAVPGARNAWDMGVLHIENPINLCQMARQNYRNTAYFAIG